MHIDLAAELAIYKDDVADGQQHSEAPPDQTHGERVRAGDGAGEGNVAIGASGGGKQRGVKAPTCAGQHEEQIEAGREKSLHRLGLAVEEPDPGKRGGNAHGNDERSRVVEVIVQAGRAHGDGGSETDRGEGDQRKPEWGDDTAGAIFQFAGGFDGEPERAVQGERYQRHQAANHRVPVENAGMRAGMPVGPQRQKEVAVGLERDAAQNIGESGAEEDREQDTGETEEPIQQRAPDANLDVVAQLKAHSAQNQQREHDHQRQIEATEGRGVEQRKSKVERAAASQQPNFVAVPNRADAGKRCAPLRLVADQEQVKHTYAQIEAVKYHVADDHHGNHPEPNKTHHGKTPTQSLQRGRRASINVNRIGGNRLRPVADFANDQNGTEDA